LCGTNIFPTRNRPPNLNPVFTDLAYPLFGFFIVFHNKLWWRLLFLIFQTSFYLLFGSPSPSRSLLRRMGTANLNVMDGSQNCVFNKADIDFQNDFPKKVNKFKNSFNRGSTSYYHLLLVSIIWKESIWLDIIDLDCIICLKVL